MDRKTWVEEHGQWWSRCWLQRSLAWGEHLDRDFDRQALHYVDDADPELLSTQFSWAAALYRFQGEEWLATRRVFVRRSCWQESQYSKTGTRAVRGRVHKRFHDGVSYAKRMLQ